MSKELEAFRDILGILSAVSGCEVDMDSERIKIVNQALQRLESIDNAKPSEALKSWNKIGDILNKYCNDKGLKFSDQYNIGQELQIIKNYILKAQEQEKVLEILFKKQVDINLFITIIPFNKSIEELTRAYNQCFIERCRLTIEETTLLKRWLDGLSNDES